MAVKLLLSLYLSGGITVSAVTVWFSAHYMMSLRSWAKASGWLQKDAGGQSEEDDATSFGQLVPIFLSLLTLFSFAQVITGEFILSGSSISARIINTDSVTEMSLPHSGRLNKKNVASNTDSLTMAPGPHKGEPSSWKDQRPPAHLGTPGARPLLRPRLI